jgi:hypothetical protein
MSHQNTNDEMDILDIELDIDSDSNHSNNDNQEGDIDVLIPTDNDVDYQDATDETSFDTSDIDSIEIETDGTEKSTVKKMTGGDAEQENDTKQSSGITKQQKIFFAGAGVVVLGLAGFLAAMFMPGSQQSVSTGSGLIAVQQEGVANNEQQIIGIEPARPIQTVQQQDVESIPAENTVQQTQVVEPLNIAESQLHPIKTDEQLDEDNTLDGSKNNVSEDIVERLSGRLNEINDISNKSYQENTHLNKAQVLALDEILKMTRDIHQAIETKQQASEKSKEDEAEIQALKLQIAQLQKDKDELSLVNNDLEKQLDEYKQMLSQTFAKLNNLKSSRSVSNGATSKEEKVVSKPSKTKLKGMSYNFAIFEDAQGNIINKRVDDMIDGQKILSIDPEEGVVKTDKSTFKID